MRILSILASAASLSMLFAVWPAEGFQLEAGGSVRRKSADDAADPGQSGVEPQHDTFAAEEADQQEDGARSGSTAAIGDEGKDAQTGSRVASISRSCGKRHSDSSTTQLSPSPPAEEEEEDEAAGFLASTARQLSERMSRQMDMSERGPPPTL